MNAARTLRYAVRDFSRGEPDQPCKKRHQPPHAASARDLSRTKPQIMNLCLPQIKPEHIGDAVHPGSGGTECIPLPRWHVISARPCSMPPASDVPFVKRQ